MPRRIRWTLAPNVQIDEATLDPQDWLTSGRAEVVKSGPHRAVYRVKLPTIRLYWKQCKLATIRAFLREIVRPPKARMEFDKAIALRARAVPTIEPLAWGVRPGIIPGESFLLTRSLDATTPLHDCLTADLPASARQAIAKALGQFMAHLHNAGVTHPDLHPGNLLMLQADDAPPQFYLLDLHAIHIGEPLGARESMDNLVMLNRWFQLRASRSDRARFWHAYRAGRPHLTLDPRQLETQTAASNYRFWRSREWRYTSHNRHYQSIRSARVKGFAVRDLNADLITALLRDPDAPFATPGAKILKQSRSSTVMLWTVETADGPRSYLYKRFQLHKRGESWLNLLRDSGTRRSWCHGQRLRDRWLPTPRPLLMLHHRHGGRPGNGYLLTEYVADAVDLHRHWSNANQADRRALLDRLARLLRTLHERHLSHRDLKATNILIDALGQPQLIDLVGVTDHAKLPLDRRVQNLARLNASTLARADVSRSDRLRFLRLYLNWGLHGKRGWKAWWREIGEATQAKLLRNQRRQRPLA